MDLKIKQKLFKKCDFIYAFFSKKLINITCFALLLLTFLIFFDVSLRFLFNKTIHGANETTELIMPYITFLPLSYALYADRHVRITVLRHISSQKNKRFLDCLMFFLGTIFCILVTYNSFIFFWSSFIVREEMLAMVKLPWYIGKFAMFIGYLFFFFGYLFSLLKCLFYWDQYELP